MSLVHERAYLVNRWHEWVSFCLFGFFPFFFLLNIIIRSSPACPREKMAQVLELTINKLKLNSLHFAYEYVMAKKY